MRLELSPWVPTAPGSGAGVGGRPAAGWRSVGRGVASVDAVGAGYRVLDVMRLFAAAAAAPPSIAVRPRLTPSGLTRDRPWTHRAGPVRRPGVGDASPSGLASHSPGRRPGGAASRSDSEECAMRRRRGDRWANGWNVYYGRCREQSGRV